MKPTPEQIQSACEDLSAIPYFPQAAGAHLAIGRSLLSFVGEAWQLRWLVDTAVDHMREWQGVAELRALYCTHFKPADGVEGGDCQITGFTPIDNENIHLRELPSGREQLKQIGDADQKALERLR